MPTGIPLSARPIGMLRPGAPTVASMIAVRLNTCAPNTDLADAIPAAGLTYKHRQLDNPVRNCGKCKVPPLRFGMNV